MAQEVNMKKFCKVFALAFLLVNSVCGQHKPAAFTEPQAAKETAGISVKYIANEGVLISSGEKAILIDGLHREYKPAYLFPPADLLQSLENARKPYDQINFVLVSHVHLDHFHAQSVGLHLQNNPNAILMSSGQAAGEVAKNFADYEKIKSRIQPIMHERKKTAVFARDGIKIKFLGLRHANAQHASIENLGHLIEIGGKKFLHIGDADMTEENFSAFKLADEKIDAAFIPYWFLLSQNGRRLVEKQFDPKQIIAVHIPPGEAVEVSERFKREMPKVISFTKVLEERIF